MVSLSSLNNFEMTEADFICPLSKTYFENPVLDNHGHVFSRDALEKHFEESKSLLCPINQAPITSYVAHKVLAEIMQTQQFSNFKESGFKGKQVTTKASSSETPPTEGKVLVLEMPIKMVIKAIFNPEIEMPIADINTQIKMAYTSTIIETLYYFIKTGKITIDEIKEKINNKDLDRESKFKLDCALVNVGDKLQMDALQTAGNAAIAQQLQVNNNLQAKIDEQSQIIQEQGTKIDLLNAKLDSRDAMLKIGGTIIVPVIGLSFAGPFLVPVGAAAAGITLLSALPAAASTAATIGVGGAAGFGIGTVTLAVEEGVNRTLPNKVSWIQQV
jgi:hypothetical protein